MYLDHWSEFSIAGSQSENSSSKGMKVRMHTAFEIVWLFPQGLASFFKILISLRFLPLLSLMSLSLQFTMVHNGVLRPRISCFFFPLVLLLIS